MPGEKGKLVSTSALIEIFKKRNMGCVQLE
jgi:hypothetical protein